MSEPNNPDLVEEQSSPEDPGEDQPHPKKVFSTEDEKRYDTIVEAWKRFLQDKNETTLLQSLKGLETVKFVHAKYRSTEFYIGKYTEFGNNSDHFTARHWDRCFIMLACSLFLNDDRHPVDAFVAEGWKRHMLKEIGAGKETCEQWPDEQYEATLCADEYALMEYYEANKLPDKIPSSLDGID